MRYVVTGGTGFIGANLVRVLLDAGHRVTCLVRRPKLALDGLDVRLATPALGDLPEQVEALARELDGADGVFHVAGLFDPGPGGIDRMVQVHVRATRGLMLAAEKAGVRRLVLCSSSVTVGFGTRERPGDEDAPLDPEAIYGPRRRGPGGALRAYHDTKAQAEAMVLGWRDVEGVVVNPDYILGPWDVKPTSGQVIVTMARRPVPFFPRGGKCFQHVHDTAVGHLLAMERGRPGRRYLLANENLSYREFLGIVARVVGRRPPFLPVPDAALAAAGVVGRLGSRLDPHRFAGLDPWVLRSMQEERYRTAARAFAELGVPRTPIEQAVEDAFRWFREHGYC